MAIELKVPPVGESITEVQIGDWLKAEGSAVAQDENLVTIESEKATIELTAPAAGVLGKILKKKGEVAKVGELIATVEVGVAATAAAAPAAPSKAASAAAKPQAVAEPATKVMPSAARALAVSQLSAAEVTATGPGGRILKEDVARQLEQPKPAPPAPVVAPSTTPAPVRAGNGIPGREEEVVPMSPLRRTVARRLVEAQNTMAMLTTFNEVDMSAVMNLRKSYQEAFQARYNVKLGFMSFFVKAAVDALRLVPQLNAEIRGNNVVYRNYQDVGVAIGGGKGLVVPVLRGADRLSFAEVEIAINEFAKRARENKIKMDELEGGTFTISNGGVYGSLLSTPIINPPQSGILGLHTIQDRPIAVDGQVVIRPMMYLALSYDHRVVDGREAVSFLKRIKEVVENPTRILLEV